jgi:hypothetical protein
VGAALTGEKRRDIAKDLKSPTNLLGFKGYILSSANLTRFMLKGESPACELSLAQPATDDKKSSL